MAKRQNNIIVQKSRTKFEYRSGNGYSLEEITAVGLSINQARDMGIRVDLRRKTSYDKNIEFLVGTYNLTKQQVALKAQDTPKKTKPKKAPTKKPVKKEPVIVKKEEKLEPPKPATVPKPVEKPESPKPKPEPKVEPPVKEDLKSVEKPKEPTPTKAFPSKLGIEDFHKIYNEETGKNALWRGKESSTYLEWLEKKKVELGLGEKTENKPPKEKTPEKTEVADKALAKKPSKEPTTEEFYKMYNEETSKNAIWRGKESGVYLKWLAKKKKELGL